MMEPVIIDEETDSGGESYFLEGTYAQWSLSQTGEYLLLGEEKEAVFLVELQYRKTVVCDRSMDLKISTFIFTFVITLTTSGQV